MKNDIETGNGDGTWSLRVRVGEQKMKNYMEQRWRAAMRSDCFFLVALWREKKCTIEAIFEIFFVACRLIIAMESVLCFFLPDTLNNDFHRWRKFVYETTNEIILMEKLLSAWLHSNDWTIACRPTLTFDSFRRLSYLCSGAWHVESIREHHEHRKWRVEQQ